MCSSVVCVVQPAAMILPHRSVQLCVHQLCVHQLCVHQLCVHQLCVSYILLLYFPIDLYSYVFISCVCPTSCWSVQLPQSDTVWCLFHGPWPLIKVTWGTGNQTYMTPITACRSRHQVFLLLLLRSQLHLWGSPFWVRFLCMWLFFNPTIEIVTFHAYVTVF